MSAVGERYSDNELLARLRGRSGPLNPYAALFYLRGVSMLRDAPEEWPTVRSERVLDRFTNVLVDAADRQPFFAWTHLMDLHAPLHPGTVTRDGTAGKRAYALGRYVLADTVRASAGQPRRYSRLYDEALRHVDTQVRRVVDTLRSAGVWENTVLIVTSDHGEAMGERGVNGHRNHYPYDELLQVPLLVRTPDDPGEESGEKDGDGDRIDAPFSLSWVHELIAETAGLDPMGLPARSPSGTTSTIPRTAGWRWPTRLHPSVTPSSSAIGSTSWSSTSMGGFPRTEASATTSCATWESTPPTSVRKSSTG